MRPGAGAGSAHRDGEVRAGPARSRSPSEEPTAKDDDPERCGERQQRPARAWGWPRCSHGRRTGPALGWRWPGRDQEVVDAQEPFALGGLEVRADELVEVGRHRSSSSSVSASRASALRVRVFTVPSGIPSRIGDLAL